MLEAILILNCTALVTNTTVLLFVLYKIGVKVFKYDAK